MADTSQHTSPLDEYRDELRDELFDRADEMERVGQWLPVIPTREEILGCFDAVSKGRKKSLHRRNRLILRLFYATGVRIGEMAALHPCDFFDDRRVMVRQGKNNQDRIVLVDPETLASVREYSKGRRPDETLWKVGAHDIYEMVKSVGKHAGLVERFEAMGRTFSPHTFRHAFASHAMERRMNLYVLKQLLGHVYTSTTEVYVHFSLGGAVADYDATNPLTHPGPGKLVGSGAVPPPFPGPTPRLRRCARG